MAITSLPTPPTRSDPVNFNSRADAFLTALPTFATEANTLQADVNAKQTDASNSAAAALASELASAASSTATIWVSGTTYAVGNVRFSPVNYLSYRRKTAGAGTTDPSADSTNWQLINGTGNVDLGSTQTLTNKTFSTGSVWNGSAVPIANGGTGATTAVNAFTAIKQDASETASGVVELATASEVSTGTDTTRAITPATLRSSFSVKSARVLLNGQTVVDFTSIPAWVSKVTVMLTGASTSGTSPLVIRVGSASGFPTTGYLSSGSTIGASSSASSLISSGFQIGSANTAANTHSGSLMISKDIDSGLTAIGVFCLSDAAGTKVTGGSAPMLGGVFNRIRVTTINGTDTLDAGFVSITWE